MMQKYLMEYVDEYDFTKTVRYKIVSAEVGLNRRELQQKFDPGYRCDNLKFYILGEKVI
jgi:hypothetical protein